MPIRDVQTIENQSQDGMTGDTLSVTTSENWVVAQLPASRPRLHFLDGLRGLAAMAVVLLHIKQVMSWNYIGTKLPHSVELATIWMDWGYYAVDVFIVLSGFCLMIPIARSANGQIQGGLGEYLKRRARRILPPYYAMLALALVMCATIPALKYPTGRVSDFALPAFRADVIVSHLLLIHNLSTAWAMKIDMPMWSVATEWQIYFLFPLLLLPLWRRFGINISLVVGIALGTTIHFLRGAADSGAPWYIGLFGMGMLGAVICWPHNDWNRRLQSCVNWSMVAALLAGVCALLITAKPGWCERHYWLIDPVVGAATIALIIACTRQKQIGRAATPLLRVLENRGAVCLGTFSYSLYLTHYPILVISYAILQHLHCGPIASFLALVLVGLPVCVGFAYMFHLAFERRFMNLPKSAKIKSASAAAKG